MLHKVEFKKPAVYSRSFGNNQYRWIRLTSFNEGVSKAFKSELTHANEWGNQGIVLDMRGNPGGLIQESAEILKLLLTKSGVMFQTNAGEKNNFKVQEYKTKGQALFTKPLIVVVDSETASAAEIVTAVLRNQSRGLIMGDTTFGKGSVQMTDVISDTNGFGGLLITTVSMIEYPNRTTHQLYGVSPNYKLMDEHLEQALKQIKENHLEFIHHETDYHNIIQPLYASNGISIENNQFSLLGSKFKDIPDDLTDLCHQNDYQDCLEAQATRLLQIMIKR